MKKKILIIDDDAKLCTLLQRFFAERGYNPDSAPNGVEGIHALKKKQYDLVLLDVMMPGDDGFEVLRKIRKFSEIPVIMLTARGDTSDRVVGLRLGADDYIPKPFDSTEIEARMEAVLRRTSTTGKIPEGKQIEFGPVKVDLQRRSVLVDGKQSDFTSNEFRLLEFLLENRNTVVTRGQITEALYGDEFDPFQRSVDILVSRLRRKINDDPKKPRFIKTLHGQGYMLTVDI
ncbi:MAG: response regulator transcription factor [Leptospirales bacterium]